MNEMGINATWEELLTLARGGRNPGRQGRNRGRGRAIPAGAGR
jgi:hypothetical protein